MTRNFVPLHIFLRHETEWQSVRETAGSHNDTETPEKPQAHIAYAGEGNSAKRSSTSAARSG